MKLLIPAITFLATFSLSLIHVTKLSAEEFPDPRQNVDIYDNSFPWDLVLDRGKILGCIYDNKFYTLGSILILEYLPRKCEQASDRNGVWMQLSEEEMNLFKENIEKQRKLEQESTYIGSQPITPDEARIIRYLRRIKEKSNTGVN